MSEGFDEAKQFSNPTREGSLARIEQQDKLKEEPYIANTMVRIRDILKVEPGKKYVEFAAGALRNAVEIAKKVGPNGRVLALDLDEQALEEGQHLANEKGVEVETRVWNINEPISETNEFDGAMVDRALAHIEDFSKVVDNMAKAVKPGGLVVAHEALWKSTKRAEDQTVEQYPGLTIDSDLKEINEIIVDNFAGGHSAPELGRDIKKAFEDAGIENIQAELGFMEITDRDKAFYLAGIETVLEKLVNPKEGPPRLTQEQANLWREEQIERAEQGTFKFSLPFILIRGNKKN